MKKLLVLFLVVLIIGSTVYFLREFDWGEKGDFKLGVVGKDKIGVVSISPERKMINSLEIDGEVSVWIPRGLGWYRSDRIFRVLEQERKKESAGEIFFYNLGFWPDEVVYVGEFENWRRNWKTWLRVKMIGDEVIYKKEVNKEELSENNLLLNEVMPRDFADSSLVNDNLRLSVINAAGEERLAGFVAKRLEWLGFTVVSTDNSEMGIKEKCLMSLGPRSEESLGLEKLSFLGCERKSSDDLGENEVELYFGDEYVQMLKYSSYK